jgi:SAM-dependent methyltransferase
MMAEAKKGAVHEDPTVDKAARTSTSNLINLLHENFVEKWNKTITAANYLVKLRTIFDQPPPHVLNEVAPGDTRYVAEWHDHYFHVGQSAFRCIKAALLAADKISLKNILDLPCGHGQVLRVLRAAFPDAAITACDLDPDAVDFCAQAFGAAAVYSADDPAEIPIRDRFDLIWCGSLLTHLNQCRWPGFLSFFNACLSPGGLLVFTVNGREAVEGLRSGRFAYSLSDPQAILRDFDRGGFGYQDYPAHTRRNFGIALSSPAWVLQEIIKQPGLRVLNYTEKGWDNHQDVIACAKA